jgi:hypothetical protein
VLNSRSKIIDMWKEKKVKEANRQGKRENLAYTKVRSVGGQGSNGGEKKYEDWRIR